MSFAKFLRPCPFTANQVNEQALFMECIKFNLFNLFIGILIVHIGDYTLHVGDNISCYNKLFIKYNFFTIFDTFILLVLMCSYLL